MAWEPIEIVDVAFQEKRGSTRFWLAGCILFAMAASLALFVDVPISRYLDEHRIRGDALKIINLSEVFAHGYGAAAILLAAWVLLPGKSKEVLRVAIAVITAGLAVNGVKLLVLRIRPEHFDLSLGVTQSFLGFFQFVTPAGFEKFTDARIHSFPSGHSATAAMLAIGLTNLVPRGKWLFACLAALSISQRIVGRDHFLSDTLASTAIAFALANLFFRPAEQDASSQK